jgi:superfamily II DNA or RNA helicase
MNRYRRILQSFCPELLPSHKCYDICDGINKIIKENAVEEILCYAPWCRYDTYRQIGVLDSARKGVSVTILVRPPKGTLRADAKSLLSEASSYKNLTVLSYQSAGSYKELVNHRKILLLQIKDKGWFLVAGSSNHTESGMGLWNQNEEVGVGGNSLVYLNDEYNVFIQIKDDDLILSEVRESIKLATALDPIIFPLTSNNSELDDSRNPVIYSERNFFAFQSEAIAKLNNIWINFLTDSDSPCGAILSMPTGSGKTFTSVRWICERLSADIPIKNVLWIAPSVELIWQANETWLSCKDYYLSSTQLLCSDIDAKGDALFDRNDGSCVAILTIQTAYHNIETLGSFDLIVVDEVHWGSFMSNKSESSESGMLETVLNYIRSGAGASKRVFALGLTATPYRSQLQQIDHISDLLCGETVNYTNSVVHVPESMVDTYAQSGQRLRPEVTVSHIDFYHPELEPSESGLSIMFSDNDTIHALGKSREMIQALVEKCKNIPSKLSMIFAVDCDAAASIAIRLLEADIQGVQLLVSGSLESGNRYRAAKASPFQPTGSRRNFTLEDRKRIFDSMKHKDSRVKILISVQMARMGIDVPGIDTLFMAVPTRSPLWYRQMLGRGLRGPLVGGCDKLTVVDCFKSMDAQNKVHTNLINYTTAVDDSRSNDRLIESLHIVDTILKNIKSVPVGDAIDGLISETSGIWCSLMPKSDEYKSYWKITNNLFRSIKQEGLRRDHRLVVYECSEEDGRVFQQWIKTRKGDRIAGRRLSQFFGYI